MATKKTTRNLTSEPFGRLVQAFTLDLLRPDVRSLQIVNGDTGHTFVITLKSNGFAVPLSTDLHKIVAVFTRADGEVYTQDADSGLSFTEAGVVTIDLRPASFRTGRNTVKLQLYKRENTEATEYPLLLTTYERAFTARLEAIEGEGENAPAQLPMLEQLIADAGDAIDGANTAAAAANDAADAATTAATAANAAVASMSTMDGVPHVLKPFRVTWDEQGQLSVVLTETNDEVFAMIGNDVEHHRPFMLPLTQVRADGTETITLYEVSRSEIPNDGVHDYPSYYCIKLATDDGMRTNAEVVLYLCDIYGSATVIGNGEWSLGIKPTYQYIDSLYN